MITRNASLLAVIVLSAGSVAFGDSETYTLLMTGAQEVPGPGDPDGLATGTLFIDDVTGEVSWDFAYSNIAAPTLMHIHGPNGAPGMSDGVFIGLGVATSGGPGTLIDSLTHGNLAQLTQILNGPVNFYVNIHTSEFGPGAVRGNLPEPASLALLALGATVVLRRR